MCNNSCEFDSRSWRGSLDNTLCDKVRQWLATSQWFSPGTPVSSTNKTDRHDMTEIFLIVALNIITIFVNHVSGNISCDCQTDLVSFFVLWFEWRMGPFNCRCRYWKYRQKAQNYWNVWIEYYIHLLYCVSIVLGRSFLSSTMTHTLFHKDNDKDEIGYILLIHVFTCLYNLAEKGGGVRAPCRPSGTDWYEHDHDGLKQIMWKICYFHWTLHERGPFCQT